MAFLIILALAAFLGGPLWALGVFLVVGAFGLFGWYAHKIEEGKPAGELFAGTMAALLVAAVIIRLVLLVLVG